MIYVYIDKSTKHVATFSNIQSVVNSTMLKPDMLYYHFTRKKKTEIETEEYRIVKCKLIKTKRTKL